MEEKEMSKKNNPKREDVIKISQELVRYDGDIDKVFDAIDGCFSKDMINKIKCKRYMAAVSNLYFNRNTFKNFDKNNHLDVVANISPVAPSFTTSKDTPSASDKPKKKKTFISEEAVRDICKYLVEFDGDINDTYEKTKHFENVMKSKIRDIKSKRAHKKISDEYFTEGAFENHSVKKNLVLDNIDCHGVMRFKNENEDEVVYTDGGITSLQMNPMYNMSVEEFIDEAVKAFRKKPFDEVVRSIGKVQQAELFSGENSNVQFDELIKAVIMKMPVYDVLDMLRNM